MAGNPEMDFATELQVRTRRQHSLANAVVNITAPIALSSPRVYRLAVKAFYHVYLTIESEMERLRRNFPKVSVVYFREVLRTKAFEEDLAFFYGPAWRSEMGPPSPATVKYLQALRNAVEENPLLIVAFCQTMYVGMFAGGQIVRGWCKTALRLKNDEGTKALDFSATIPDIKDFRNGRYKDAINSLQLTQEERDKIIEQKRKIFELNNAIFAEVRASAEYRSRVASVAFVLACMLGLVVFVWIMLR